MKIDPKAMKCVKCGGWANPAKLRFEGMEMRGWKCACGEEYLHGDDAEKSFMLNKARRGLLETKVAKVGNSYSVRLPMGLVDALNLKGRTLKIFIEGGRIVLEAKAPASRTTKPVPARI